MNNDKTVYVVMIIVGSIGMIGSLILSYYVFKKDQLNEYINLNFIKDYRYRRLIEKQQKLQIKLAAYKTGQTVTSSSLGTSGSIHSSKISQASNAFLLEEEVNEEIDLLEEAVNEGTMLLEEEVLEGTMLLEEEINQETKG